MASRFTGLSSARRIVELVTGTRLVKLREDTLCYAKMNELYLRQEGHQPPATWLNHPQHT